MDKKLIRKHQRTTSEPNFKLNLTKKKEFEDEDAINYIKSIQRHSRVLRMNTNIWLSRPKTGLQVQKIREKNLIMEFSRSNSISNRSSVQTGLFSYKMMMQLSRDGTLKVNIPDTLVYGYGFKNPTFLYTNEDGLVKFRSSITLSHVNIVTDILESYRTSNSPLAIMKTPNRNFNRVFLHATEIKYEVNNSYKNEAVIQRYILPKGIKAFKIRISWSVNETKIFTICNKERIDGKRECSALDSVYYVCSPKEAYKRYGKNGIPLTNHTKIMQKKEEANENSKQDRIKIVFNDEEETQESQLSIKKRQTTQIIKMDKYFAKEKGLLGKLVELGSFEDTFRNNSYFEDTNNKNVFVPNRMFRSSSKYEYESQDLEIISNASFSALKLNKPKQIVSEDFFDYLNSINCKPQIPVQKLYQELHSHQIEENFENGEIDLDSRCLSNFYINRLRSMFCTDSENPDKSIIYEVKLNRSFNEALRQLHEIRDHINKFILAKEQQKLSELVIDFAEDKQNQFYFLKVFTYKCTEQNVTHIDVNKQTGFICVGDYCKIGRKFSRFNNKTIVNSESIGKVILRKTLLIDKLSENLDEILNPRLYESVLVCPSCYKFYKDKEKQHEERLMKEKLEKESQKIVERRVQKILNQLDPKENKTVSLEKNKSMGNSPRTQPLIVHRRYKSMFLR